MEKIKFAWGFWNGATRYRGWIMSTDEDRAYAAIVGQCLKTLGCLPTGLLIAPAPAPMLPARLVVSRASYAAAMRR